MIWELDTSGLTYSASAPPTAVEFWIHTDETGSVERCYWSQDGELPKGAEQNLRLAAGSLNEPWVKR